MQDKLERELGSAKLKGSPFKDKGKLNKIKDATEKIGKISKRIRGIQNDKVMTAQEKRVELDRLNKKRNNIAIEAMERMNWFDSCCYKYIVNNIYSNSSSSNVTGG